MPENEIKEIGKLILNSLPEIEKSYEVKHLMERNSKAKEVLAKELAELGLSQISIETILNLYRK
jgi:hypothetical protein